MKAVSIVSLLDFVFFAFCFLGLPFEFKKKILLSARALECTLGTLPKMLNFVLCYIYQAIIFY